MENVSPELKPEGADRWYTPTEVAKRLGLGYPTVLKFAQELGDQLEARRESNNRLFFSEADLEILRQHRKRPRADGLTVGQMAAQLGVSSHRLKSLVDQLKRILPKPADARPGIYAPEAVEILRQQLVRSARKKESTGEATEYWRALAGLRVAARQFAQISRDLESTYSRLRANPPSVTAYIHTLPGQARHLARPIAVVVSPHRRSYWRASLPEAKLQGIGRTMDDAVLALQAEIVSALTEGERPGELRALLKQIVRQKRRRRGDAKASEAKSAEAQAS